MQNLTVVGVQDDVLIVEAESGERYTIDANTLPEIKRRPAVAHAERKLAPREIQSLIRGGLTAEEVAGQSGEDVEYIRRFELPVVAERRHMLDAALSIPVASADIDPLAMESTFGAAIEERLSELRASDQAWSCWKKPEGSWMVRLTFTTEQVEKEADWAFEPKKATLAAKNKEATALSTQGDAASVLVPRLRAVDRRDQDARDRAGAQDEPQQSPVQPAVRHQTSSQDAPTVAPASAPAPASETQSAPPSRFGDARSTREPSRFDSGAFRIERASQDVGSTTQPENVQQAAIKRSPAAATEANHTADLLEALRRRRGERESALAEAESIEPAPLFEVEADASDDRSGGRAGDTGEQPGVQHTSPLSRTKRGSRASMPSWDEIVFGSRGDDDEPA